MKLDLPDGDWADLRDPRKVPQRLRSPVKSALSGMVASQKAMAAFSDLPADAADMTDEQRAAVVEASNGVDVFGIADTLNELVVVALVDSWSFSEPVSVESLRDLPGDAYDVLCAACAPHLRDMIPEMGSPSDPKAGDGG